MIFIWKWSLCISHRSVNTRAHFTCMKRNENNVNGSIKLFAILLADVTLNIHMVENYSNLITVRSFPWELRCFHWSLCWWCSTMRKEFLIPRGSSARAKQKYFFVVVFSVGSFVWIDFLFFLLFLNGYVSMDLELIRRMIQSVASQFECERFWAKKNCFNFAVSSVSIISTCWIIAAN